MPPSSSTVRLLTTYVITTDKAAREYSAGRRRVNDHMSGEGGIQAFIEGVGHFETCINAAKRGLRALGRLGTQPDAPALDRTIRRLAQSWATCITDIRDAIEHIDADIVNGTGIPEGDAHLLTITKNGESLEIGPHKITVIGLYGLVKALHGAGTAILHSLPTVTSRFNPDSRSQAIAG